jgi:hypothetical protein
MSHHFDSPTAIADGRLNLCDVYAFPGKASSTVLVLTVNPDAGRSSPISWRPDAVYEFAIASAGDVSRGMALRVLFGEPDHHGLQKVRALMAVGDDLIDPAGGVGIGGGLTGREFGLIFPGLPMGRGWAGLVADPFWADGAALFAFLENVRAGRYTPEVFAESDNVFDGRNVTAVVLEVPDRLLSPGRSSVWATVTLHGHAPARQVSRMGQPMLRPLFFNVPGRDTEDLNAGRPADDRRRYASRVAEIATALSSAAGHEAPDAHGREVAEAFLPDVLGYTPGVQANFWPGSGNGRALTDDAFGSALAFTTGAVLAHSVAPAYPTSSFPYLNRPNRDQLPPLAELFGLRPPGAVPA